MGELVIDPPAPHSPKQAMLMQFFLDPRIEEIFVANGTKWGKTLAASSAISVGAWESHDRHYRWIAPIYKQAKIGLKYCTKILPPSPFIKVRHGDNEIEILGGRKTILDFYHARDPEALEGFAINGYCFDEAAKQSEDAYLAARTTQSRVGNKRLIISTPLGKNWFYRRSMEAREEMLRARHEKRIPRKIFITAPTSDNPTIPPENIESARRELPERLFRQYYEAEFVDDFDVFSAFRRCLQGPAIFVPLSHERWIDRNADTDSVVIGVDWAKKADYTVFVAFSTKTRRLVGFYRFTKSDYIVSIGRLVQFGAEFGEVEIVFHDKTGVGESIDEQMVYTGLPFRGIIQTNAIKNDLVNRFITGTEQRAMVLPFWESMISELDSYEIKITKSGNFTYAAAQGATDDIVSALLFAYDALEQYSDRSMTVRWLEDIKEDEIPVSAMEAYYKSLAEAVKDGKSNDEQYPRKAIGE